MLSFRGTGRSFNILGATLGQDAAAVELGLDLKLTPQAVISLGYEGNFSGRGQSHAIRGCFDWRF
jgi:uncharacterized protein with beta-barrel porin domain